MKRNYMVCLLAAGLLLDAGLAAATTPVVNGPFYFRENRGSDVVGLDVALGATFGDRLIFGATVTPNGIAGTTATRAFGADTPVVLPFNPRTIGPNEFSGSTGYTAGRAASTMNMVFTNGSDSTSVSVNPVGAVGLMPLATLLSVSGTGTDLTFHWTDPAIPSGLALERAQIYVYDLENKNAAGVANSFISVTLSSPSNTSYALTAAQSSLLLLNHHYAFGVRLEDLREGITGGAPARLSSSQAYFDFTPTAAIPEPETYGMLLMGLGLMGFMAGRRKR